MSLCHRFINHKVDIDHIYTDISRYVLDIISTKLTYATTVSMTTHSVCRRN